MKFPVQRTLKKSIDFSGVSLHSGQRISVELCPAPVNSGIVFSRTDLPGQPSVKASPLNVTNTRLATRISDPESKVTFSTTEHLLAAVFALGITNLRIQVKGGEELPIMDGSSLPFLMILDEAGIEEQNRSIDCLLIKKPIEVIDPKDTTRFIRIEPSSQPMLTYSIDFKESKKIGHQSLTIPLNGEELCKEILYARTFCQIQEIEFLKSQGLALGGSLQNAIVVDNTKVLNQQGLRDDLEFVRHKILDCVGDLALLGKPVLGHVFAFRAGHDLHTQLAKKIELAIGSEVQLLSASTTKSSLPNLVYPKSVSELLSFFETKALVKG